MVWGVRTAGSWRPAQPPNRPEFCSRPKASACFGHQAQSGFACWRDPPPKFWFPLDVFCGLPLNAPPPIFFGFLWIPSLGRGSSFQETAGFRHEGCEGIHLDAFQQRSPTKQLWGRQNGCETNLFFHKNKKSIASKQTSPTFLFEWNALVIWLRARGSRRRKQSEEERAKDEDGPGLTGTCLGRNRGLQQDLSCSVAT